MMVNWIDAAHERVNTYNWLDTQPSTELIESILQELHDYSPSKQRLVRYEVVAYKNDDEEKRNKIYRAHAVDHTDTARHNPQTLAPWLLFFKKRDISHTNHPWRDEDYYMDIGIAVSTIIYSASDKGLDTGMTRCINYEDLIVEAIGFVPEMTIGIGYRNTEKEYMCPYYNKMVPIMDSDFDQKPEMDEYITLTVDK